MRGMSNECECQLKSMTVLRRECRGQLTHSSDGLGMREVRRQEFPDAVKLSMDLLISAHYIILVQGVHDASLSRKSMNLRVCMRFHACCIMTIQVKVPKAHTKNSTRLMLEHMKQ